MLRILDRSASEIRPQPRGRRGQARSPHISPWCTVWRRAQPARRVHRPLRMPDRTAVPWHRGTPKRGNSQRHRQARPVRPDRKSGARTRRPGLERPKLRPPRSMASTPPHNPNRNMRCSRPGRRSQETRTTARGRAPFQTNEHDPRRARMRIPRAGARAHPNGSSTARTATTQQRSLVRALLRAPRRAEWRLRGLAAVKTAMDPAGALKRRDIGRKQQRSNGRRTVAARPAARIRVNRPASRRSRPALPIRAKRRWAPDGAPRLPGIERRALPSPIQAITRYLPA